MAAPRRRLVPCPCYFCLIRWVLLSCLVLSCPQVVVHVHACTDILVTPGASADGSAMIAYNADSPTLYGILYHYPANTKPPTMRSIYDWDSGKYLGTIPEANQTYNVVGNANEHGLIIGESTFGGVPILAWNQSGAIMDYGSLIYITLQRAKTVQEAIPTMVHLMDTYGYASGGESFSFADRTGQVWMMEVIGRGNTYGKKGAVWVAVRIPDGSVAAHANQARITTFERNNPDNCLFADDVVDVAIHYGLYPPTANPTDFSFSDTYDPVDFMGARQGEARVWSIFSKIADSAQTFQNAHVEYALGHDLSHRMPLYIQPYQKLSVTDVMQLLTSHYEDTPMDSSRDVGSGLFETPYRPRPLTWTYHNNDNDNASVLYHNERSVATPKTGWSLVGQTRSWMPRELSAILWFAVDDSSTAPRVPVYASSTDVAPPYQGKGSQDGITTPLLTLDLSKAFWIQNMVSNFCYYRWKDVYPLVRHKIDAVQREFLIQVATTDSHALKLYHSSSKGPQEAIKFVTNFSVSAGTVLHQVWFDFYGELFVRFRDFYTIVQKKDEPVCGCEAQEPGMSMKVKERIVTETGEHYKVPNNVENDDDDDKRFRGRVIHGESSMNHVQQQSKLEQLTKDSSSVSA